MFGAAWLLSNNRQHMAVCAKTLSSWVSKGLSIEKAYMYLGTIVAPNMFQYLWIDLV